jgi:LysR family positive regulator for ilvC
MAQDGAVTLDELRLFLDLSRTLRFARTSESMHLSPSALSRSIARLEDRVGRPLFERDQRTVALTPAGARLVDVVEGILGRWDEHLAALEGEGDGGTVVGTLSLYCTVTASQSILPEILHDFRDRFPGVRIDLETGDAADALDRLSTGTDVAVAALAARAPSGILTRVIARTPLVPVVSSRGAPARIDWETTGFVLPSSGAVRSLADAWFRAHRRTPIVAAEAHGHEAVLSLVTLGCGVGIVPRLVVEKSPLAGELTILPSRPRLPELAIAVCSLPDRMRHPPVRAFWETLPA